jgi:hypothetical protein
LDFGVKGNDESDEKSCQQIDHRQPLIPQFFEETGIPYGLDNVVGSDDKKEIEKKKEGDLKLTGFDFDEPG